MSSETEQVHYARITLHPDFHRGLIDRRLFGSFVEHMGRCVYSGIFEPDHPGADEHGFRTDVAALIGELGTTLVRYPGGNFVSGYDWRDGIGPVGERPQRLDLAWRSVESNRVGTDEFLPWARRCGIEPMLAVNLGTGTISDAAALVEYCNLPGGTDWADRRHKNGHPEPHDVRLWCLGNEMDGPWQIGHKNAEDYAKLAAEAAKAMRLVDPDIELVACGSSSRDMETFGTWEATVLEHTFDVVDYLSMHAYYDGQQQRSDFLASGWAMSRFIDDVVATADAVAARRGSSKRIGISFDEWNVWSSRPDQPPGPRTTIEVEPQISEDPYQMLDAVVVGDLLISLLNHADRVRIACLSLLVNVSAPIMTERGGPATRQTTFHPMAVTTALARGRALVAVVDCQQVSSPRYGDLPAVGVAATHDPESGRAAVFLVNRSEQSCRIDLDLTGICVQSVQRSATISAADPAGPRTVRGTDTAPPSPLPEPPTWQESTITLTVPPCSWTALELALEQ